RTVLHTWKLKERGIQMFYDDRILSELKRAANSYSGYKGAFASFCAVARAVFQEHPDLGVTVESETDHSVRLGWIDHLLQIDLSIVTNTQPTRGVLKLMEVERDGERETKKELARIYIDELGNAWNNPAERTSMENIKMPDGATGVLLKWLRLFLHSEPFSL